MLETDLTKHDWLVKNNSRSLEKSRCKRELLERIRQLEQALEQSLHSGNELSQQLKDQHLIENQLAATEEIANLQQQAIHTLQQQLAKCRFLQTSYVQVSPELARERERYTQMKKLNVELQEQIVQQSQQVGEYQAALQYWKDRYLESIDVLLKLKEACEQLLPNQELTSELQLVQRLVTANFQEYASQSATPPLVTTRPLQVELPPFLTRK